MAFPFDPKDARVFVSATLAGTYTLLGKVRSAEVTPGTENAVTTKYLGGQVKRAGDPTIGGRVSVLYDPGDTTGQVICRAAWAGGTTIGIQFRPAGSTAGEKAFQFEATVTECPVSFDADAELVEGAFTFDGDATTYSEITLA
jgi:hypothetical protein